jgi:stage II sporulation protein AA (anti-sigma F factor antagonist)
MSSRSVSHLQLEQVGEVVVARFAHERMVDETVIRPVGEELMNLVDRDGHRRVVLNFGAVHFMASAVIAQLFKLLKKLNAGGGKLKFCAIRPDLLPVFKITGLDKMVQIFDEEHAAVDACK